MYIQCMIHILHEPLLVPMVPSTWRELSLFHGPTAKKRLPITEKLSKEVQTLPAVRLQGSNNKKIMSGVNRPQNG